MKVLGVVDEIELDGSDLLGREHAVKQWLDGKRVFYV